MRRTLAEAHVVSADARRAVKRRCRVSRTQWFGERVPVLGIQSHCNCQSTAAVRRHEVLLADVDLEDG